MTVEQLYTGCLAEAAYYIESDGEVAIIDPLRESGPYIRKAELAGAKIKYVFETHFHADFVSGHVDLSKKTGAIIVYGPTATPAFDAYIAKDGEEFQIGKLTIQVLHTPGHTPESTCYLCIDEQRKPYCLFTGDTLFIGDVGRPDLAQKSADRTEEEMASELYDSLRNKIMPLNDDLLIYPAHGAGSACGKNMSKETFDTLGSQKERNYALSNISKENFVKELTTGILPPPQYFSKNVQLNKEGVAGIEEVYERSLKALGIKEFEELANQTNALVLDVRSPEEFAKGFIPHSIFIGLDGQFAPWVGALVTNIHQPILLVVPKGREEETIKRLARVGYDYTIGYLDGGFQAWLEEGKEIETVEEIDVVELGKLQETQAIEMIDVRRPGEYEAEHIENVENKPLDFINDWMSQIDSNKPYYVHCAGGYRSMITISILKARGVEELINIKGGFSAIKNNPSFKLTTFSCTSKNK